VRYAGAEPFTAPAPAMAARHVGGRPGFVDEHQLLGIEVELAVEPVLALLQDVGTVLLGGVRGLFLRVIRWRSKNRHSVPMPTGVPRPASSA